MSQCAQNFYNRSKSTISVSPAPHPLHKFSRTVHSDFQREFHFRDSYYSQGLPAPSMMSTSPTLQSHTKLTPEIAHEPKTIWVCPTFNYNATPLAPPGTQVIIHERTTVRGTWESHGVK